MRHFLGIRGANLATLATLASLASAGASSAQELASAADTARFLAQPRDPAPGTLQDGGPCDRRSAPAQGTRAPMTTPRTTPRTSPGTSPGSDTGSAPESVELNALLERLAMGEIELGRAFAGAQRLAERGDHAAAAWCLSYFDAARVQSGFSFAQDPIPYSPAEASVKLRLYGSWLASWSGELEPGDFDPLASLDREARALQPALGRDSALEILERMQDATVGDRDLAEVLLTRARILARGSELEVQRARSLYRRLQRRFHGTAAAHQAARAIWRSENLTVGRVAPDFVTNDFAGNEIRLSDFRGQIVVVHFWQEPGGREREDRSLDKLRELAQTYWDTPFALIGVHADASTDLHRVRWVEHGVVWHEAFEPFRKDGARAAWHIDDWPSTYVIDAAGVVRAESLGSGQVREIVDPLVKCRLQELEADADSETPGPR